MVFGSNFSTRLYEELDLKLFKAYGGFSIIVGFDMMILEYGPNAICSTTGERPGMNGWQAEGQLYALLEGSIGIKGRVKVKPGCDKVCIVNKEFNITILNGSVAAVLNAQVPNPSYLAGRVGCEYEILSVIKGNFDFGFELGQYCHVTGS